MQTLTYPVTDERHRRAIAHRNFCPECGSEVDTGWECNNRECQYDARDEALSVTNADVLALLVWERADERPAIDQRGTGRYC
jgi:hypothetical protein